MERQRERWTVMNDLGKFKVIWLVFFLVFVRMVWMICLYGEGTRQLPAVSTVSKHRKSGR